MFLVRKVFKSKLLILADHSNGDVHRFDFFLLPFHFVQPGAVAGMKYQGIFSHFFMSTGGDK